MYVAVSDPLVADIAWIFPGTFSRSASFNVDPSNIGSGKIVSVSWECTNLDYENDVNGISAYIHPSTPIASYIPWHHYGVTSGTISGSANIVSGALVMVVANLDNTV